MLINTNDTMIALPMSPDFKTHFSDPSFVENWCNSLLLEQNVNACRLVKVDFFRVISALISSLALSENVAFVCVNYAKWCHRPVSVVSFQMH